MHTWAFMVACLLVMPAKAQQCDTRKYPLSTPTENYVINDNGSITDIDSGLTWRRCVAGQAWNGETCIGKAQTYSWHEALGYEEKISAQNASQDSPRWRMPRLAELAGIVERQCRRPRINLQLFPNTPSASFWTANAKKGTEDKAYALSFDDTGVQVMPRTRKLYLRLVSGRD